jgi:hypothetical protein
MNTEAPTVRGAGQAAKPAPPPKFTMPPISQGDLVRWYSDRRSDESAAAFVAEVSDRSLTLHVLVPGAMQMMPLPGVRHRNDPELEIIDNAKVGVWDYRNSDAAANANSLFEALGRIRILDERITALEAALTQPQSKK